MLFHHSAQLFLRSFRLERKEVNFCLGINVGRSDMVYSLEKNLVVTHKLVSIFAYAIKLLGRRMPGDKAASRPIKTLASDTTGESGAVFVAE